ncbi:MAG: hypothetical protein ACYTGZ_08900 [Planctomycetota bacterium]
MRSVRPISAAVAGTALILFMGGCQAAPPTTGSGTIGTTTFKVKVNPVGPQKWTYVVTGTGIQSVQLHSSSDQLRHATTTVGAQTPPTTRPTISNPAPTDVLISAPAGTNGWASIRFSVDVDLTNGKCIIRIKDTAGQSVLIDPIAGPVP